MPQRFVQTPAVTLLAPMSASATTCVVTPYPQDLEGVNLTMTDFGSNPTFTVDPKITDAEEICSFTGITDNGDGTATITGITRNLGAKSPYTTLGTGRVHGSSSVLVFSDNPQMFNRLASKENDETITGSWTMPAPVAGGNPATKDYVDSIAMGGATTVDRLVVIGVAGETVAAGQVLYYKAADGRWWKASSAASATTDSLILGIAQGAGTAGNNISGGVLLRGMDSNQSGLTLGALYYLSTGGAIATSAGTVERAIGHAKSTTALYFDPDFYYIPTAAQKTAITSLSTFGPGGDGSDGAATIASGTTTLTRDMYYTTLVVNGTGILATAGFKIFASVSITVDATTGAKIINAGGNATNAVTTTPGAAGAAAPGGTLPAGTVGVIGGAANTAGTNGVAVTVSAGVSGVAGGSGGNSPGGGVGGFGPGGTAGTATASTVLPRAAVQAANPFTWTSATAVSRVLGSAGSGSGAGGATNGGSGGAGGGSGGSGGWIYLETKALILTAAGCVQVPGGNGGNGGDASGGSGGGGTGSGGPGGVIVAVYRTKTGAGTMTAAGGTAGQTGGIGSGGTGGNGALGSTGTTGKIYEIVV